MLAFLKLVPSKVIYYMGVLLVGLTLYVSWRGEVRKDAQEELLDVLNTKDEENADAIFRRVDSVDHSLHTHETDTRGYRD